MSEHTSRLTIEEALKALSKEFYPRGEEPQLQERFEFLLREIQDRGDEIAGVAVAAAYIYALGSVL